MADQQESEYKLVRASAAQDAAARRREWAEWGHPLLTPDEFNAREGVLDSRPFGRSRVRWLLVSRTPSAACADDFHAACETYTRRIFLGGGEEGLAMSVCSVYVEPSRRGRGYAQALMRLLSDEMKRQPDVKCAFLFSDIGDWYARFGFQVTGATHVEWAPALLRSPSPSPSPSPDVLLLGREALPDLAARDTARIRASLPCTSFALADMHLAWDWHWTRALFYAARENTTIPHFAATLDSDPQAYVVWSFDWPARKVPILRLAFSTPEQVHALVAVVRHQAAQLGFKRVIAWNLDLDTPDCAGGTRVERHGDNASLPCLAWYGEDQEVPQWAFHEYGGWC